jgi:hypothetical protein
MKTFERLMLAASSLILMAATPLPAAQSEASAKNSHAEYLFLLPDGFRGWVCVDFAVAGAQPLPHEGDARVIRPREGQVLRTSDKSDGSFLDGQAWYEIDGQRRPLPDGVTLESGPMRTGPREPTERSCAFVGTIDEREAAAPAPGFENLRQQGPVPPEERRALEALYKSTGGDRWTHRVGWMGPPGTECNWHGVDCVPGVDVERVFRLSLEGNNLVGEIPGSIGQLSKLESLDLSRNHLTGKVPSALGRLEALEWLSLYENRLSGLLPDPLIQRWLAGPLQIIAEAHLLTDISEIDSESRSLALLCATDRIIFRADSSVVSYSEKCRNASPDDRTTFCEVKEGRASWDGFARLGWLLEKNGFFGLSTKYSRNITHSTFENTRVTKGRKIHAVSNYAGAGPFQLWVIQRAIEGVTASVDWETTRTQPNCPRW